MSSGSRPLPRRLSPRRSTPLQMSAWSPGRGGQRVGKGVSAHGICGVHFLWQRGGRRLSEWQISLLPVPGNHADVHCARDLQGALHPCRRPGRVGLRQTFGDHAGSGHVGPRVGRASPARAGDTSGEIASPQREIRDLAAQQGEMMDQMGKPHMDEEFLKSRIAPLKVLYDEKRQLLRVLEEQERLRDDAAVVTGAAYGVLPPVGGEAGEP